MTTTKVPQFGDPEILPRGTVRRPSPERMPFTNSGALKPGGPGPLTEERFTEAPDLAKIPQWTRKRGTEWTTAEFRQLVFTFIIGFFDARDWPGRWDITEVAGSVRSVNRLPEDRLHLVIGITPKDGQGPRVETAIEFPANAREDNPDQVRQRLASAAEALNALHDA